MNRYLTSVLLVGLGLLVGRFIFPSQQIPSTQAECALLPTPEGIRLCIRNLPREIRPTPTPIPWNTTEEALNSIKTTSPRVTNETGGKWAFSSVITNLGSTTINRAIYSLEFYSAGDDAKNHMPVAEAYALIEGPIEPSKSLRFKLTS
jgi:hypothetical protein